VAPATSPAETTRQERTAVDIPWAVVWIAVAALLLLRLIAGRALFAWRIRKRADLLRECERLVRLRGAMSCRREVRLTESSAIGSPVAFGWEIVVPRETFARLTDEQKETILAHEIAHVRRHDYLVNLLQTLVETLLFYHPAVWWISSRIRMERELCCDDVAVGLCDRLVYATALTDLAAMMSPRVALAATGGDLLGRVRRILQREEPSMSSRVRWMSAVVVMVVLAAVVPTMMASVRPSPKETAVVGAQNVAYAITPPESERGEAQERARTQAQLREEIEALKARIAALMEQLNNPERPDRLDLRERVERDRDAQERARRIQDEARRAQLDSTKQEIERMRALQERGLISGRQVQDLEAMMKALEQQRGEAGLKRQELDEAREQIERAKNLFERGLASRSQIDELQEQKMKEVFEKLEKNRLFDESAFKELVDKAKNQRGEQAELFKQLNKEFEAQAREKRGFDEQVRRQILDETRRAAQDYQRGLREVAPEGRGFGSGESRMERDPADRSISSGDFLFVTIDGENLLPELYRIEGDGTVKLPLLGSFKVVGRTPSQVREAIGKRLSDTRLGSASKVRVQLAKRRPER